VTEIAAAPDASAAPASGMADGTAKTGAAAPAGHPGGRTTSGASRTAAIQPGARTNASANASANAGSDVGAHSGTNTDNNMPPAPAGRTGKQAMAAARVAGQPAPAASASTGKAGKAAGLANPAAGYDFGGTPAAQHSVAIDIGRPLSKPGFNLITPAIADDMPTSRSCAEDRPRYTNPVKELQGNREYHVSQYLPNLYDTTSPCCATGPPRHAIRPS